MKYIHAECDAMMLVVVAMLMDEDDYAIEYDADRYHIACNTPHCCSQGGGGSWVLLIEAAYAERCIRLRMNVIHIAPSRDDTAVY